MAPDPAPSLVVDCSVPGVVDDERLQAMRDEAFALFNEGKVEEAKRLMDEIKRIEQIQETSKETYVEVDREQWDKDQEAGRQLQVQTLRLQRNSLLRESDWALLPDVNMTQEQKQAWRTYRQALRDWPSTVTDPFDPPDWPEPPQTNGDNLLR